MDYFPTLRFWSKQALFMAHNYRTDDCSYKMYFPGERKSLYTAFNLLSAQVSGIVGLQNNGPENMLAVVEAFIHLYLTVQCVKNKKHKK